MKTMNVETFGLKNVEARKKTFIGKAKRLKEESERKAKLAKQMEKFPQMLDEYVATAEKATAELMAMDKVRMDGKTANALNSRGLAETCGLVEAPTRIYCSNDELRLENVWWADAWVLEVVENLKKVGVSPSGRKKFYDHIKAFVNDKDAILTEAGLIALGHYSD